MPHTTLMGMRSIAIAMEKFSILANEIKVEMAKNDQFKRYMEDSVTQIATTKEGILVMVIEFSPGSVTGTGEFFNLCGCIERSLKVFEQDKAKSLGKNIIAYTKEEYGVRLIYPKSAAAGDEKKVEDTVQGG